MITDFHTHSFPDHIAKGAISALEKKGAIKAHSDGSVGGLKNSMKLAGIDRSVICSIATKVQQFESILTWSKSIRSKTIIPLPSIHPGDPDGVNRIKLIKQAGFYGIKMHPYYQDFLLDDPNLFPLYQAISKQNLLLVMHTGYDIGFSHDKRACPQRILKIISRFPDLKLITTHLGAWEMWEEMETSMLGKPIYMEISFALNFLSRENARRILMNHPENYLLFGTDSPWDSQQQAMDKLKCLGLGKKLEKKMLVTNAQKLLQDL